MLTWQHKRISFLHSSVHTALYMSERLVWSIITQEFMVTTEKSDEWQETYLSWNGFHSRIDSYSWLINERFLITSTVKVYIHNKDNVVSIVTRVFGLGSPTSVCCRSYEIFSKRSTHLAFYSLSTGGSFPMERMPGVISWLLMSILYWG